MALVIGAVACAAAVAAIGLTRRELRDRDLGVMAAAEAEYRGR